MKLCMEQTRFVEDQTGICVAGRCKVVPLSVEADTGGTGVDKQLGQSGGFSRDDRDFSI